MSQSQEQKPNLTEPVKLTHDQRVAYYVTLAGKYGVYSVVDYLCRVIADERRRKYRTGEKT